MKVISIFHRALEHREVGRYESMERRFHLDALISHGRQAQKQPNKQNRTKTIKQRKVK